MNTFPTVTNPDYNSYTDSLYKPVRRTEFEGNTVAIRPRTTTVAPRRKIKMGWSKLPDSEYQLIKTFFQNNSGKAFYLSTPFASNLTVTFSDDTLKATAACYSASSTSNKVRWKLDIEFEEVTTSEILANE